ncbi:50S ribosomal protein L2 [Candidatus Woesearchaeota archaeon]|nr:50S ribosomal protein L2 [Candidatus Woesearchaeota archaeon]
MGKNIIAQARGHGGPTYRAPSFRYKGKAAHPHLSPATLKGHVQNLLHCQGHSAPLAEIKYENGETALLLASEGMRVGDVVVAGPEAPLEIGNTMPLKSLPEGTVIYNIESVPGDGGKFVRASGGFARIVSKMENKIIVKLPSKKQREFHPECRACVGIIAGGGRLEKPFLKAGVRYYKMRAKNKLWPQTSGNAMNAVDHPFGNKRSLRKSKARPVSRHAPPGRKVGMIAARRTGRKKL